MASKDNKKRGEVEEPSRWTNEILGIIWITVGLLLLLALVKYSPADLPKWGLLEAFASKSGASGENLIGPVGGLLAFLQILLFGAACYMIPVAFIWFGVVKLAFDQRIWPRRRKVPGWLARRSQSWTGRPTARERSAERRSPSAEMSSVWQGKVTFGSSSVLTKRASEYARLGC